MNLNSLHVQQADVVRLLQGRGAKYLIQGLNVLLVIWIAAQLASLVRDLLSPEVAGEPVAKLDSAAQPVVNPDRQLIAQLPSWHLMGEATQQQVPAQAAVPVNAPDTRLKLTLRGALASNDPVNARAIISDPRGKDEQYAIGDTLPGNAEVSKILPDRVILKRSGRYETLRLPDTSKKGGGWAKLQRHKKSLYDLVRITPAHLKDGGSDGMIQGYTLSPGSDKALFKKLGLEDGDVVLRVNDVRLEVPEVGKKVLKNIESGDSVNMTILRGGQEQVINVFLQDE